MKNLIYTLAVLLAFSSGCSMCCGPFDYDYPAFGGKHIRADRSHGRVGSVLSDPIRSLSGPSADSNLSVPKESISSGMDDDDDVIDLNDSNDVDSTMENDSRLEELEKELEGIEPLRNERISPEPADDGNSTASNRWRPRPLRSRIR